MESPVSLGRQPHQTSEGGFLRGTARTENSAINPASLAAEPRRVTRSGNQEQLLLPIARHLGCSVCLLMRDEDAAELNELVLERRRLIRRLDELNDLLLEIDLRTIEPALRKGSITVH